MPAPQAWEESPAQLKLHSDSSVARLVPVANVLPHLSSISDRIYEVGGQG